MSKEPVEKEFTFKDYFIPLTTTKAIHYISLIGFIIYGNALLNGFVWDDFSNIVYNQQGNALSINNIFGKNDVNLGLQYRPFVNFYFSLMYSIFRDVAFFYHLFNIFFHIINSLLVFFLFKRFFSITLSFFLSLIFLVHPMQVESATWISTAGNFYFLFGLLAFLISLKIPISVKRALLVSFLLLLALLSKETGIVFLGLVFLNVLFKNRRQFLLISLLNILVVSIYCILRIGVSNIFFESPSMVIPIAQLSLEERLLNIPAIIVYYFKTFFYPVQLVVMQFWVITEVNLQTFYIPLFIILFSLCLIFAFGIYLYKCKHKDFFAFLFFFLCLLIGLSLHLNIAPLNMTVADRWFYFPMVGVLGLMGLIIQKIGLTATFKKYASIFGIVIILLLSYRTILRNTDWKDNFTLFSRDSQILTNYNMENNLGNEYKDRKDYKTALQHYEKSVELYPSASHIFNLGVINISLGRKEKAREYFDKTLTATDYYPEIYSRALSVTAWMLLQKDTPQNAKSYINKALKKDSTNPYLWAHLAISEYKLNNKQEALIAAEKAQNLSKKNEFRYLFYLINNDKPVPTNINIVSQ